MANKTMHHFYVKDSPDLYEIVDQTARNSINELSSAVAAQGDIVQEMSSDVTDVVNQMSDKVDSAYVEDGVAYFCCGDNVLFTLSGIGGGGSGGDSQLTELVFQNTTGWATKTMSENGTCILSFNWASIVDGYSTGSGTLTVTVRGLTVVNKNVAQGAIDADITRYIQTGTNRIKASITDSYGNVKSMVFTVTVITLSIASSYDQSAVRADSFTVPYVVTGSGEKTVYFKIDGVQIATDTVDTSGWQSTHTFSALSHGGHILEMYAVATIDGAEEESNHIRLAVISAASGNTTPVIASNYDKTTCAQYDTIVIPYYVYDPNNLSTAIDIFVNGNSYTSLTVDRTQQVFVYRARTVGNLTITIECGDTTKTFTITVSQSTSILPAITTNQALYLSAEGRSNNEANPGTWTYNNISATMSNFNFASDGWLLDDENNNILRVTGDARVTVPYKIFERDVKSDGKTIELDFAVSNVRNYEADIITCWSNDRGLKVTAQNALIASSATSLNTQYKEDEHVRISFVIERITDYRLIYIYINGILSGVTQYGADSSTDNFTQGTPVGISIGSNDATVDIYNIRIYDQPLTRQNIVTNWIADTQNLTLLLDRHERNDVYENGLIVMHKLPSKLPYLVVEAPQLPPSKGEKRTVAGYYVDPLNPSNSFTFTNASMDVQGTSSQGYPRKNYKIKFKNFTDDNDNTTSTYYLRGVGNCLPSAVFCFKADYASSEGANNVELVRLYEDACPTETPPQEENSLVRQGIDGLPIVIFWTNTNTNTTTFLGKYNFNYDKSSPVFGFEPGDESWETSVNDNAWGEFKNTDFTGTGWQSGFEPRYPDVDVEDSNPTNLAALSAWINSTYRAQATGDSLESSVTYEGVTYSTDTAAYRLAKFRNELTDWFDKDDVLYYYLFTELFLMIDSRVKNSFPTLYASHNGAKWMWLPYDMDTAIGINNEGKLVFDYSLEDTDMQSATAYVYNSASNIMWNNVRDAFPNELQSMYQSLRSGGIIDYDVIESRFEAHQSAWAEAVFNEDAYFKYILPFTQGGDNNLYMCLGSKEEQRKWWLYNRFRYIDSKYTAGYALTSFIQARVYQKSNLSITPYADIYASALFDSSLVKARAPRNVATTVASPVTWNPGGSDAVLRIYSADQIKNLGDLSGFYVGDISFAAAVKIQEIKLGDASDQYSNPNLQSLTLGNNVLLRKLDVRNCPNLTQLVDVSGCTNIEELYFDGTSITGVVLPNGGVITTLHLPDTVTGLTIRNQTRISDFVLNRYLQISSLRIENSSINEVPILLGMANNGFVRLLDVDWETETYDDAEAVCTKLSTSGGITENGTTTNVAQVSGNWHAGVISDAMLEDCENRYPNLNVTYDSEVPHQWLLNRYINDEITEYFDSSITKITHGAFYYRSGSVYFPNVTEIEGYAFSYFESEISIRDDFPKLETISGNFAFGCDNSPGSGSPASQIFANNGFDSLTLRYINCSSIWARINVKYIYLPNLEVANGTGILQSPNIVYCEYFVAPKCTIYSPYLFGHENLVLIDVFGGSFAAIQTFSGSTSLAHLAIRNPDAVVASAARYNQYSKSSNMDGYNGACVNVYVPRALITSYQQATNWTTRYANGYVVFKALEDYTVDGTTTGELDYEKIGVTTYHEPA